MTTWTWQDVTVAIPTVTGREAKLTQLLAQVREYCDGAEVIVTTHVLGEPARVTFPRALAVAAATMRPWILQLEDDVALAPTFGVTALEAVTPSSWGIAEVVTLFTRSREDLAAMDRCHRFRRVAPASFSMSQAFFLRRDLAADIEAFAPGWYERHPQHNRAADLLLASFLSMKKARVLAHIPSLVQHRRGPSTLPGHYGARQSESYRRAFGEVE